MARRRIKIVSRTVQFQCQRPVSMLGTGSNLKIRLYIMHILDLTLVGRWITRPYK